MEASLLERAPDIFIGFVNVLYFAFVPIGFLLYMIFRWVYHFYGFKQHDGLLSIKALWYLIAGFLTLSQSSIVQFNLSIIIAFICFMEFWDNWLTYRRNKLEGEGKYKSKSTPSPPPNA